MSTGTNTAPNLIDLYLERIYLLEGAYNQERDRADKAEAARDRALADIGQYRRCLEAVAHFWQNDPLAFGDEATPTTLAGRFATIGRLCGDTLSLSSPGAKLLAELETARAIITTLRRHRDAGGEVWRSIDRDFAAYDAAVKQEATLW